MFIEELQHLYRIKQNKGEVVDSIDLCNACHILVSKEMNTRAYTSRDRQGHYFAVSKLFGKPIIHDIEEKVAADNIMYRYERCIKHGLCIIKDEDADEDAVV